MSEMDPRELQKLVEQMHDALQAFCEEQAFNGDGCPMWREEDRHCGKQCKLRDIEDAMRILGFEVEG